MKKNLSLALALVMMLAVLTGCGQTAAPQTTEAAQQTTAGAEAGETTQA